MIKLIVEDEAENNYMSMQDAQADFDRRPVGVVRFLDRRILWSNETFAEMFGYDPPELVGRSTRILYPSDDEYEQFGKLVYPCLMRGEVFRTERAGVRRDGSLRWFDVNFGLRDQQDASFLSTFVDITDRRDAVVLLAQQHAELQRSEEQLRRIFAKVAEGVVFHDQDGRVVEANPAATVMLGLTREQMLGRTPMDPRWHTIREDGSPLPGDEHPAMVSLRTGKPMRDQVMGILAPGRGLRWININSEPVYRDGGPQPTGVVTSFIDFTEKRESFERIRQLAQRVEVVREDERRVIASRLHEGVAQDLFAAQLALKHLETQAKGRQGVMQAYQELSVALTNCMESARMLANELRPAGLNHERLKDALRRHADLVALRCGLNITVTESEYFPALEENTQLLFFRTFQEALTNIVRHAHAKSVSVNLEFQGDRIVLTVEDDGVGIKDEDMRKPGSLGLIGLRERYLAAGGEFSVIKRDSGGTRLSAFVFRC